MSQSFQSPYRTAQVVGCALTYLLVAVLMSWKLRPLLVTMGMAIGFAAVWSAHAAGRDQTGMFLFGTVLLVPVLLGAGVLANVAGTWLRLLWPSLPRLPSGYATARLPRCGL
ncbi:hypothetical protein [Blastococcus sp. VKM Ac-2987]|uniref:hypothetical protein n=1 Tax=Blastococcus sp. VKM Ac-2987 TaxID=3004141 RepID=UPI0022ABB8F2|nr:hypothetical protein [Blastococcus sp. VKM Ac-2987]MCZ2857469.1 hypothetical protein [Blastococcus sp. VKM Ac-2987]